MRRLLAAVQFLTILPVHGSTAAPAAAAAFFPVVGALIGALGAGVLAAAARFWPPGLAAALALAFATALSGGLHEDGLADVADAFRAGRLKDNPDLFTGLFWTGRKGLDLGLVDALGDMRSVLKARYGQKTRLRLITAPRGLFGRRLGIFGSASSAASGEIGAAFAGGLIDAAEERALWSRYGL